MTDTEFERGAAARDVRPVSREQIEMPVIAERFGGPERRIHFVDR